MGIGVPIGIIAAHRPKFYPAIRPVLDLMQTLPTFVYLIPAIVFFGIGMVPGLLATAIFVLPAPIRLTHLGVSSTPLHLVEAGEAFRRVVASAPVENRTSLRHAANSGRPHADHHAVALHGRHCRAGRRGRTWRSVVRALNSVNTALGFEAGLVIVVVAIVLDRIFRPGKEPGE